MLILQRKKGESIIIDNHIEISIVDCGNDGVKLAIEAPKEIQILRSELVEAAKANKEAALTTSDTLLTLKNFIQKKENE
ncbi:carbon storage regulator [Lachnospiraceae bacterium LCP25S3_G4]